MSKPPIYQCKMYCKMYSECKRTDCPRKPLSKDGGEWNMVELSVYNYWRSKERYREWREDRITKIND